MFDYESRSYIAVPICSNLHDFRYLCIYGNALLKHSRDLCILGRWKEPLRCKCIMYVYGVRRPQSSNKEMVESFY